MVIRKIGGILRGKATPMQVFLACVLGALIGFVPGLGVGWALLVLYLALLLVLNANIGLALFVATLSKFVALLAAPFSFAVGRALIEGPGRGLVRAAVNAPVLAWLGLDHYLTTGGIAVGLVVGVVLGLSVNRTISAYRRKMASVEAGSERYRKLTGTVWSRFFLWLLVGGRHGKATYGELLQRRTGNPLRVWGVLVVVLLAVASWLFPAWLGGPILTKATRSGLETWNGATVDLAGVQLDLVRNRLVLDGLALADPNALDTDVFRAVRLEGDLSATDLLRRRLSIDKLVVVEAENGTPRATPGVLVGPEPEPAPSPEPRGEERSIDDYIADARAWQERLAQVREWLEAFASDEGEEGEQPEGESMRERLEREVAEKGYAAVTARGLLEQAPLLLVREIVAGGVRSTALPGDPLDLRITNVSTHPGLVDEPVRLQIDSRSGRLAVDLGLGGAARQAAANTVRFALRGIPSESVAGSLDVGEEAPLQGGTLDLDLDGSWSAGRVGHLDLPLTVTLQGVTVALSSGARRVEQLVLPLGLRGPIDNPRISFDDEALQQALLSSAKAELEGKAKEKLQEAVDEKLDEEAKGLFEGLLGGKKKKEDG